LDTGFNPDGNGEVNELVVQSDGKILIGGSFTSLGSTPSTTRNRVARLNSEGTLDTFNPNVNGVVRAIAVQSDGKIVIGGDFTTVGGVPHNYVARLNSDGTLDSTFNGNIPSDATNLRVWDLAVQSDGKIIIGGNFTKVGSGSPTPTRNNIARLNSDGSLDTGFNPDANGGVNSVAVQSDGKIIIGGSFDKLNNNSTTRARVARLNSDGTLDTFAPFVNSNVSKVAVQSDGKILIGGSFTQVDSQFVNRFARLNSDGTPDSGFNPNVSSSIDAVAVQSDGKILIGGFFTLVGGITRNRVARLNSDGSLDTGFNPDANGVVRALAVQSDGKIIIGGGFTTVGGVTRNRVARLS
jgi:uncharacterized delta-60 repeat protein